LLGRSLAISLSKFATEFLEPTNGYKKYCDGKIPRAIRALEKLFACWKSRDGSLQSNIWEGDMPKPKHWAEFVIEGVIGWIWIAISLVAVYFLVRAIFFGGGWWRAIVTIAVAWFLYKVTLYYQLQRTGELPKS